MNKPPGASLLGALVRVTRFERAISTSQMWRGTSSATPGYSVLSYYTTPRAKIKVFPVCGQSCGQSRFSVRFRDPAKSHKRPCCKAFWASALTIVDGAANAPKAGALPVAVAEKIIRLTLILNFFDRCHSLPLFRHWRHSRLAPQLRCTRLFDCTSQNQKCAARDRRRIHSNRLFPR